jgi:serine/threonine-protein kinase RIO1
MGIREVRQILELMGKLSGELKGGERNVAVGVQITSPYEIRSQAEYEENERRIAEIIQKAGREQVEKWLSWPLSDEVIQ